MAVNRLGISAKEYYNLTPLEAYWAFEDNKEIRQFEYQTQYETARFISFHIWNSAGRSLQFPYQDVSQIMKFPWEQESKQSWEDMLSQMKTIAAVHNERLKKKQK